jgi:hypothetical protein
MAAPDFSVSKPPTAPISEPIRIPVPKKMAPPPAFSDIAKAANDVRTPEGTAIALGEES